MTNNLKKSRQEFSGRLLDALADLGYQSNEQNALGKLFGVSGQAVKKWINGESTPSTTRMPEIANILGVRKAWLFDGEGPMREICVSTVGESRPEYTGNDQVISISQEESEFLCFYRRLPEDVRLTFRDLIQQFARASNKN